METNNNLYLYCRWKTPLSFVHLLQFCDALKRCSTATLSPNWVTHFVVCSERGAWYKLWTLAAAANNQAGSDTTLLLGGDFTWKNNLLWETTNKIINHFFLTGNTTFTLSGCCNGAANLLLLRIRGVPHLVLIVDTGEFECVAWVYYIGADSPQSCLLVFYGLHAVV